MQIYAVQTMEQENNLQEAANKKLKHNKDCLIK